MTWSLQKTEFRKKLRSILPLKFEYANHLFPIPRISFEFYDPAE